MGEFSAKNLKPRAGLKCGLAAAGCLVGAPVVLDIFIQDSYANELSDDGTWALFLFMLFAVTLGSATTATFYLHCSYPSGSKPRLLFGMVAGALIVVYALAVLVISGMSSVLQEIGFELDMGYAALVLSYASAPLMLSSAVDYLASRKKWLESFKASGPRTVDAT